MIAALFLLSLFLVGCEKDSRNTVNINDYIIIETSGYNEYGSISVSVDYETMIAEHINKQASTTDTIDLVNAFPPFTAKYKDTDDWKNGDVIKIKWTKNKEVISLLEETLGKKLLCDTYKYTVDGLSDIKDYNPFDDLHIENYGTMSGSGSIDFTIQYETDNEQFLWNVEHNGKDGSLKNGDTIHLTIADDIDKKEFTKQTGLKITQKETDYTIDCLCVVATDETIFSKIADTTKSNFDTVIEEWVVAGLNDTNVIESDPRTYQNVGYVYYANATINENGEMPKKKDGMFFAIYEILDYYVATPYYVFIGIEGEVTVDHERIYLNGQEFSDSFVNYEKEKVRYTIGNIRLDVNGNEIADFKWVEGEEMGFVINNIAFAGHQTIQETLDYIKRTYGLNYTNKFISEGIQEITTNN